MVSVTRVQKNLTVTLFHLAESAPPADESGEITREEFRARLRAAGLLVEAMTAEEASNPALEAAREKFRAAGTLVIVEAPDSDYLMSDEDLWALTDQITDGSSVDEIMKDIRGEY